MTVSRTFDLANEQVRDLILEECARVVRGDGLLVIPTDTVYGIAADAFSPQGVAKLLQAKGRGRDMPPPVLVPRAETVMGLAEAVDSTVMELTARFWPGPLTIICNAQPSLHWDLGDTHGTVGLRMPDHEDTLALLSKVGPLAVSSANLSGEPAAVNVEQAQNMLGERVDIFLDGGEAPGGQSSTIIDMSGSTPRVLREGPISFDELAEVVDGLEPLAPEA
ncbi:L-threonylcarbamoyladenylate synthase [Brevibacterium sp. UMB1308A]|uniref:L-threonylcarbamoyladenylate synthase n=1 Tax=Brevibacterium sp. UMB1308A TaxID=3050608 RepID=UPI00254DACF5|nr:L-threonylcarbamoyladenylate synthase [Brevibacterium sp. UMB1308A]MDK8345747.1 L-threonylcarbamoyladenylate synthase [Brevibacterium sp. UMB1308B]MDK8713186.1 L-threonylcarbamoyladenylate synthase [Brevibacterium sp. UMB1308A]